MNRHGWHQYAAGAILLLITLAIYGRGINYPLLLDDQFHIQQSLLVRSLGNWWEILKADYWERPGGSSAWRPILKLAFAVQYSLWGDSSAGYRLVLTGLHWLAALLVYKLGRMLGLTGYAPLLAGAIFAAHPAMVEVTHNAVALSDLVGVLCSLVAIILVLPSRVDGWRVAGALLALIVGLGFKESVLFSIPVICLAAWHGGAGSTRARTTILTATGCVLVGAVYLGVRLAVLQRLGTPDELKVWPEPAWATKPTLSLWLIGRYAAITFWPATLHADYRWLIHNGAWMQQKQYLIVGCAAVLVVAIAAWRGRRDVRLIASAIIVCGLLAYLQIIYVQSFFAERHLSFSLVGVGLLIGYLVEGPSRSVRRCPPVARAVAFLAVLCIFVLAARSAVRVADWRDAATLWQKSALDAPTSVVARTNLALAFLDAGQKARAQSQAIAATRIEPAFAPAWRALADAERSRANWVQADVAYREALQRDPEDAEAMIGLSKVLFAVKNKPEAILMAQRALAIQPSLQFRNPSYLNIVLKDSQ